MFRSNFHYFERLIDFFVLLVIYLQEFLIIFLIIFNYFMDCFSKNIFYLELKKIIKINFLLFNWMMVYLKFNLAFKLHFILHNLKKEFFEFYYLTFYLTAIGFYILVMISKIFVLIMEFLTLQFIMLYYDWIIIKLYSPYWDRIAQYCNTVWTNKVDLLIDELF